MNKVRTFLIISLFSTLTIYPAQKTRSKSAPTRTPQKTTLSSLTSVRLQVIAASACLNDLADAADLEISAVTSKFQKACCLKAILPLYTKQLHDNKSPLDHVFQCCDYLKNLGNDADPEAINAIAKQLEKISQQAAISSLVRKIVQEKFQALDTLQKDNHLFPEYPAEQLP